MKQKSDGPFRNALAKFIRKKRKFYTNADVKQMIPSFCAGWEALSNEMDKVFEKYK